MTPSTEATPARAEDRTTPRRRIAARNLLALFLTLAGSLTPSATLRADGNIEPPAVPEGLDAPEGHRPYRIVHAYGTQNQVCLPRSSGVGLGWAFYGPQATLFDGEDEQIGTHFLSITPVDGVVRATWQHSRDTSAVWAQMYRTSSDPDYVAPGAIAWLLLEVKDTAAGPDGGAKLARTTWIQRINTLGGATPGADCPKIGDKLLVPYEADYVFYRAAD